MLLDTPDSPEALQGTAQRNTATARAEALLNDRIGPIPVWIRAPKTGAETYTVSIREPGKERGCRLFHLGSILEFISRHELGAQQEAK